MKWPLTSYLNFFFTFHSFLFQKVSINRRANLRCEGQDESIYLSNKAFQLRHHSCLLLFLLDYYLGWSVFYTKEGGYFWVKLFLLDYYYHLFSLSVITVIITGSLPQCALHPVSLSSPSTGYCPWLTVLLTGKSVCL